MEKKLDLEMPGVMGIDHVDMKSVNGGGILLAAGAFLLTYVGLEAALNPSAHIKAFKEGQERFNENFE